MKSTNQYPAVAWLISLALLALVSFDASARDWYPVGVDVWEPPFNTDHKRVQHSYTPLEKADKRWNLCVSIPHLKDAYWLAVNYGLVDEASRMGVNLVIFEAGGYERLDVQRQQVLSCLEEGVDGAPVDGLILSAISATGLNSLVETARSRGVPVLDLINGLDSPDISARTAADFYDVAFKAGEYLKQVESDNQADVRVAWFPGPAGAAWVSAGDKGFHDALAGSSIKIVAKENGDTGKFAQARLIESVLDGLGEDVGSKLDYIVGTTVSAEAAVGILRQRGLDRDIKVMSYYYGPGVHQGIKRGSVIAAPTDSPTLQARIAVDTMVRILEDKPFLKHTAPQVVVIDRKNQRDWDSSTTLAPRGFRAIFSVLE